MKTISRYLYNIIFLISRIFSISFFSICLLAVLHAKYTLSEIYSNIIIFFIDILETISDFIVNILFNFGMKGYIFYNFKIYSFSSFCKNSQSINLLITALILILIIGIISIKYVNKGYKYLLTVSIISSISYLIMYTIFKLPIMIALAVFTPIILLSIYVLNKKCPIQEVIVLIPIIGEIFCTKKIIQYIFKNNSNKITNFSLLLIALIVSNVICFLFPYKMEKDFENRIMDNWTYSIRPYEDKLIISGDKELIIMDRESNDMHIKNKEFMDIRDFIDFVINENKKEIYFCSSENTKLLMVDIKTLNTISKLNIVGNNTTRLCCNNNFSKLIIIYESSNEGCLIDINTYSIKYIKGVAIPRDCVIYNKYRNCFLISFYEGNLFLQEIDVEQRKIRKIKADKRQGYMAISERNKEVYVAFHQQGMIGVYDAETMKLKRKIRSNYTVKDITYDEELNVLIAPSYFTGYVDIFLMDENDKLLTREFVGYELREGSFDFNKENLYVCSEKGLYRKKIDIKKLIEENFK